MTLRQLSSNVFGTVAVVAAVVVGELSACAVGEAAGVAVACGVAFGVGETDACGDALVAGVVFGLGDVCVAAQSKRSRQPFSARSSNPFSASIPSKYRHSFCRNFP